MATSFEKPRDLVGGLVIVAIGGVFLLFGRELPVGSSFRMGPGYFPTILSWLMMAMGAVMAGLAWRAPHQEGAFGEVPWRGLLLILGATVVFGLGLRGLRAWRRCWCWWCSPPPGPAATPACGRGAAGAGDRRVLQHAVHHRLGPAAAADRPLAQPAWWSPPAAVTAPAATTPTTPAQ